MTSHAFLTLLPFITCLFWLVLAPLLSKKDSNFSRLVILLLFIAASELANTVVNIQDLGTSRIVFFIIYQFTTTSVIPLALSYVNNLGHPLNGKRQSQYIVWVAFPISLVFVDAILIMLAGTEEFLNYLTDFRNGFTYSSPASKVEQISYICSVWVFNLILAVQAIIFVTKTLFRASERHLQSINILILFLVYAVQTVFFTVFGANVLWCSLLFPVLLSISLFLIAYTGLFHNIPDLSYSDLLDGNNTLTKRIENYDIDDDEQETTVNSNMDRVRALAIHNPQEGSEDSIDEDFSKIALNPVIADAHKNQIDEDRLRMRFEDLIITEQLFLRQGIRISEIAVKLNTNRTYVSRMVNNTYNMSFSDYINTLRIDYAEQYLLHHKNAKQSDIATACGFPNASSFNNVFKKITGVTPKIWLATNDRS